MPRAGEIHVTLTARTAAAMARWLAEIIPTLERRDDTILTPGQNKIAIETIIPLKTALEKSATRKRAGDLFTMNAPRQAINVLISIIEARISPLGPGLAFQHRGIMHGYQQFRAALKSRRGRPTHLPTERSKRLTGQINVEERHRKRVAKRERRNNALNGWLCDVTDRSETILTATIPFPKI